MNQDYIDLGVSQKVWNRWKKLCVAELGLRKSAGVLEVATAIKAKTGSTSQSTAKLIRSFYLNVRAKRRKQARLSQVRDYVPVMNKPIGPPHPDYKKDDGFYTSRAWRELRLEAIRNMRACQACGRGPAQGVVIHVDHIIPRYRAPHLSLVLSNLQCLCDDCNIGKGVWDETDFRHFRSI